MEQSFAPFPDTGMQAGTGAAVLPSARHLLRRAWAFYRAHAKIFLAIQAIPLAVVIIATLAGYYVKALAPLSALLGLLLSFLSGPALAYAMVREGDVTGGVTGAYNKAAEVFHAFLWMTALYGAALMGGMMLFVAPGLLLALRLTFVQYIFFAEDWRGLNVLVRSWQYARDYTGAILWRILAMMIVAIPPSFIIIFPLSFFERMLFPGFAGEGEFISPIIHLLLTDLVIIPFVTSVLYIMYREIRVLKPHLPEPGKDLRRRWVIAFALLGTIPFIVLMLFLMLFLLGQIEI